LKEDETHDGNNPTYKARKEALSRDWLAAHPSATEADFDRYFELRWMAACA